MEHSVPQNVTSFEFHLVGDMTLKQFGYLATGMIIAYLAFVAILPVNSLIAVPIIGLSGLSGIAFAFFPIADRPLDHWLMAFLKAVYSPTQGFWRSPQNPQQKPDPQDPAFKTRFQLYLQSLGVTPPQPPAPVTPRVTPVLRRVTPTLSTPPKAELSKLAEMTRYIASLQSRLTAYEQKFQSLQGTAAPTPPPASTLPVQPPIPQIAVPAVKITFKPSETPKTQLLLTSTPNIINGIITDTAGSYLEGAIISIHDKNNLPVRALKTNKLGQFAGATPLPDGVYTVIFEKDPLEFDALQVTLNGSLLPPLSVSARKGAR